MSGFFGCVAKEDCVADVFYGTDYHSHLGTKRAGMAFYNGGLFLRSIHSLESAYFRNKFEPDLPKFMGSLSGIGVISDGEAQPITITSHLGRFSLVTIGRVDNIAELTQEFLDNRINFAELSGSTINQTELIAILLTQGDTFKDGIELVQRKVKGSCSMMILTVEGLYVSRDKYGRTPMVIGRSDKGFAIATESSSFANLDYKIECEIGAAQTFLVTADALTEITPRSKRKQICAFMWVYYGYPSSYYEGVNVEDARYRCGCALAHRDAALTDVDLVSGVPDSGVGHAIGYSNCKGTPYKRAFVKYTPTWPRSFMPQNQSMRDLVAKMKLLPNEAFTKDAKIVLLDDSIVRGTQLKDNVIKLIEAGADKIHLRVACPPLIYPCLFLNFSTSRSTFDLITRRIIAKLEGTETFTPELLSQYSDESSPKYAAMIEELRCITKADTLKFQHLSDLVKAIGLPKEDLCTHCWDNSSYM